MGGAGLSRARILVVIRENLFWCRCVDASVIVQGATGHSFCFLGAARDEDLRCVSAGAAEGILQRQAVESQEKSAEVQRVRGRGK